MPRQVLATPAPRSRHGFTARCQSLVLIPVVMLGEVEEVKQVPQRRAIERHIGVFVVNNGVGEVIAAAMREGLEVPIPLDELENRDVVGVAVADVSANGEGRNSDQRDARAIAEEVQRLYVAGVIEAAALVHGHDQGRVLEQLGLVLQVLVNARQHGLEQIQLGGEVTGTTINPVRISSSDEFEAAFAAMEKDRPDAVIVQPSLPGKRAAELALKHRVPAVSVGRWFAEEGGLMSYSAKLVDLFRKAAVYVDKILKGVQPADLPVEQPTHFELIINMKTAKALGIDVPPALLARADEVIE